MAYAVLRDEVFELDLVWLLFVVDVLCLVLVCEADLVVDVIRVVFELIEVAVVVFELEDPPHTFNRATLGSWSLI